MRRMNYPLVVPDAVAAVLRVTGEDAFAYLQSQFSGDLRPAVREGLAVYGLWLSRKGRVEADSIAVALGADDVLLISYYTSAAALEAKVSANVVADDAEFAACAHGSFTFAGDGAADALRAVSLPVPERGRFARAGETVVVPGRRGGESYEVIFLSAAASASVGACIREKYTVSDACALEPLRVVSGVPRVPADCGPGDLPQEAGLDDGGVCFDKGCYLGQEVMARLKAQGRPTRFLARVEFSPDAAPRALPAPVWAGDAECGEVRSMASIEAGCVAFAMLRERVAAGVDTFSFSPGGPRVIRRHPSF